MADSPITPDAVRAIVADLREQGSDTRHVEAKRARKQVPKAVYETLSSFSNTKGGLLLLGVSEEDGDFVVSGVEDPGKIASDLGAACSEMKPVLHPDIDIVLVDGAAVVVADIPPLPREQRPCFRKAAGIERGTFLRRFDGDVRATDLDLQLMIAERRDPRFDLRAIDGADLDDLDPVLVEGLVGRLSGRRGFRGLDDRQILRQVNALVPSESGALVPSAAGLLALGRHPQTFLGRVRVEYSIHPSEDRAAAGVRLEKSENFAGPIPYIVADVLTELDRDLRGPIVITEGKRRTLLQYPRDALREAIVNALLHRDLRPDVGEATTVAIYPDRLVIGNPGGLFGLTEEDLTEDTSGRTRRSIARNQALVQLLEDTPDESGEPVAEARATGIPKMLREMRDAGMSPPVFRDSVSYFEVEFPKHTLLDSDTVAWLGRIGAGGLRHQQQIALAMARRGQRLDNTSYRQATGIVDSRQATRDLGELRDQRLLQQREVRRAAHYVLGVASTEGGSEQERLFDDPVNDPVNDPVPPTSEAALHRAWVLEQIDAGRTIRRPHVRDGLELSDGRARRLIRGMVGDGLIVFSGPPKTGTYRRPA